MPAAAPNTKPDLRRTLTCAALATLTSLAMFSFVANLMTPMFAGIRLLASDDAARPTQTLNFEDTVCLRTAHGDEAQDATPSAI